MKAKTTDWLLSWFTVWVAENSLPLRGETSRYRSPCTMVRCTWWYAAISRLAVAISSSFHLTIFDPMPSEPCMELSIRYGRENVRLPFQSGESVTQAIMICGVYAYVNPSCCERRSKGSVLSEGHTSSV